MSIIMNYDKGQNIGIIISFALQCASFNFFPSVIQNNYDNYN